jgi:negative regulator of sigma E activity
MFPDNDRPHPDWEMTPSTQRRFTVWAAVVCAVVVLLNVVGGPNYSIWDNQTPDVTQMASL